MDNKSELKRWILHSKVQMILLDSVFDLIREMKAQLQTDYSRLGKMVLPITYGGLPASISAYYQRAFFRALEQLGLGEMKRRHGNESVFLLEIGLFWDVFVEDYPDMKQRLDNIAHDPAKVYSKSPPVQTVREKD